MEERGPRSDERGQAAAEWIGLLLGVTLALGGALTAAQGAHFEGAAHGLGTALSERMTCAARDACRGASFRSPSQGLRPRPSGPAASRPAAPPPRSLRPPAARAPDVRPFSLRYLARGVRPALPSRAAVKSAGRRLLRSLGRAGERAWLVCLGMRRFRQELDHPQAPQETISADDALDIFNKCLNPLDFLLP